MDPYLRLVSDPSRTGSVPAVMPIVDATIRVLSAREFEVVRLVAEGLTDAEIAGVIGITERTARAHVAAARSKLQARSRTHLAVLALRQRLIPLDID